MIVVIQCGIYRHRIIGLFNSPTLARQVAEQSIINERDHYHWMTGIEMKEGDIGGATRDTETWVFSLKWDEKTKSVIETTDKE